jgi:hypothetical protein
MLEFQKGKQNRLIIRCKRGVPVPHQAGRPVQTHRIRGVKSIIVKDFIRKMAQRQTRVAQNDVSNPLTAP